MKSINHVQFKAAGILISVCGYTENPLSDEDDKRKKDKYKN